MLIDSPRILQSDHPVWDARHRADEPASRLAGLERRRVGAIEAIRTFVARCPDCYVGISWGKDSTVLAHLVATSGIRPPLVYVRTIPTANPDCDIVRDVFLSRFGADVDYHEVVVQCGHSEVYGRWGDSPLPRGFAECARRFGAHHVSAIRAQESSGRKVRMRHWGLESPNTVAPMGWWKAWEVFAYLHRFDLPVHPAYACNWSGAYDRDWIRVDSLSGHLGEDRGRYQWEQIYYREELRALGCLGQLPL